MRTIKACKIVIMDENMMDVSGKMMSMLDMNERMISIGDVISALRKENGLTQEELGKKTNLNRTIIVKIENSQRAVSLEEAVKIAKVFSIDVDTMYSYIQDEEENSNEESFVIAFKAKGMNDEDLKEIKRIELLVDALFAQNEIRGE
jgi:Predicted transcriptional regulators